MPDHFHAIIKIRLPVGAGFTPAQKAPKIGQPQLGQQQGIAPTVSAIVGAYKSIVANECLKINKSKNASMGKFWQRNYYEHIIRNEGSYQRISQYIIDNPPKWGKGMLHDEIG